MQELTFEESAGVEASAGKRAFRVFEEIVQYILAP